MPAINLKAFRGAVPRTNDRLLAPNQATRAVNCKLTAGRLDPLNGLGLELTTSLTALETIYRYRHFNAGVPTDYWMTWESDVDAVMSPLANDTIGRLYFTSEDFEPRMTTWADAIGGSIYPQAWYALGLPNPTEKAVVTTAGGTAPLETRFYTYTFVDRYGAESGPAPTSDAMAAFANGTWTLSNLQTAPPNSGTVTAVTVLPGVNRVRITLNTVFGLAQYDTVTFASVGGMTDLNGSRRILEIYPATNTIDVALTTAQTYTSGGTWTRNAPHNTTSMVKRIYRTAGTEGGFQYVGEVPVATTTFNDAISSAGLGESLATVNTLPPPKNMTALISLPNGCLVGLAGNELCLSDPYMPYSWPLSNRYSFSGKGVALCPSGNSVIVLTDSNPIIFAGSDPEAMSPSVLETYAPCVSKRGMADAGGGCVYPSFDGLWLVGPGRVEKLTKALYREEEWSELNPASMVGEFHDGSYYAHYTPVLSGVGRVLVLNMADSEGVIEVEQELLSFHRNKYDGRLYVGVANKIMAWDANLGVQYNADWISATQQSGRPVNFAVAQIHAQFGVTVPPNTEQIAANEALLATGLVGGSIASDSIGAFEVAGSLLVPVVASLPKKVQFTLYADGVPVFSRQVDSSDPFRLPGGFRSEVYNVGINANIPTYSVAVASSMDELAQVSV